MESVKYDQKENTDGTTFSINFDNTDSRSGKPPARFLKYQKQSKTHKVKSTEEILHKQKQAEERRQAYEKAKIERIKERTEECRKIDEKVHRLGVNTNYFHSGQRPQNQKPLSSRDAAMSVKSLAKDFSKITTGIKTDALFAQNLNEKNSK